MSLLKNFLYITLGIFLVVQGAFAQCDSKSGFAKQLCQAQGQATATAITTETDAKLAAFKGAPLSTSLTDIIRGEILPTSIEPPAFAPLLKLERNDDGAFLLKAGIYEAYLESYSLEPYDLGTGRPSAFFPARINGRRAKVISSILKYAELHPDVPQAIIQNLLGLTVYGIDLEKMPAPTQQGAARLLPKDILMQLHGATQTKKMQDILLTTLGRHVGASTKEAQEIAGGIAAEKQIDQQYGVSQTVKDLATSSDAAAPMVASARGAWMQMPGGFYVRYLPDGYAKTRLQVIVPDAAMEAVDPKHPLTFDPTQYLAVHTGTPAQRLGVTLRSVGGR
jgi:hypothetical protein